MVNNRDWDEEFWNLTGHEPADDDDNLGDIPQLAVIDLGKIPEYKEYLKVLTTKEKLSFGEYQSYIASNQAKAFLQSTISISLLLVCLLSFGWTIWYWVR